MSTLKNRDIFFRDPLEHTIPNDGVAKVVVPRSDREWDVLRYELRSFVYEGEYLSGMERVLSTFLEHLDRPMQPAAWVSGFYGSGKSHFVRVLEYLWRDVELPDGSGARSLVTLPSGINALLTELSRRGRIEGGLWSAAGTLGSSARPVRLGLLSILFRAAGLPEQYPAARLVLWLIKEGFYEAVRAAVDAKDKDLNHELRNMYVSPTLADAFLEAIPDLATNRAEVHQRLHDEFPRASDISDEELLNAMEDVLSLQSASPGKFPLTLVVFDELQQFIAEDPTRTLDVQTAVEACSTRFESRLLFVATGQSALQETPQLSKLQGRFSVRVTLSDTDVEKVVREVVLRKSPDKVGAVKSLLDTYSGEIDRHLAGTRIGPRPEDAQNRVADYPLLPVRRRLWEAILRAIDEGGTAGQLRTQLRVVHEGVQSVADKPLGTVVPTDSLYWQLETHMLQSSTLLRDMATTIRRFQESGDDEGTLRSHLCALIFLLNKLQPDGPGATGVRATADALADLMVDNLPTGSVDLRHQLPNVLDELVNDGTLMLIGDEYRLQTRESTEWEREYQARLTRILSDDGRIASDRWTDLKDATSKDLKGLSMQQGASKTVRRINPPHFGPDAPPSDTGAIPIWVRDEWSISGRAVREEAQAAGVDSPIVFVFLPRLANDELRDALARRAAAKSTLDHRSDPQTPEAREASAAMRSRAELAEQHVNALLSDILRDAEVFLGGGNEVTGATFADRVQAAAEAALPRLFARFGAADYQAWGKVFDRAREGAADALTALGYHGDIDQHPVCQAIRDYVGGAGKKGSEVRRHFMAPPYGWPQDAVDGGLLVLLAGGFLRASRNSQAIPAKGMTHQQIGVTDFFREGITVTARQRVEVRGLAAEMGLSIKPGEEADAIPRLLAQLLNLAGQAGGDPPLPERPDTTPIKELQGLAGNEQFVAVHDKKDVLGQWHSNWSNAAKAIEERLPQWQRLESLLQHGHALNIVDEVLPQAEAIRSNRSLLDDPNPVPLLLGQLSEALRATVLGSHWRLAEELDNEVNALAKSEEWSRLTSGQQQRLLNEHGLGAISAPDVGTDEKLLNCLEAAPLATWEDKIAALPGRGTKVREAAAKLLEPKAVSVRPPSAMLKSPDEVEEYVGKLKKSLLDRVSEGTPVVIP